jgi:hypothetical protein
MDHFPDNETIISLQQISGCEVVSVIAQAPQVASMLVKLKLQEEVDEKIKPPVKKPWKFRLTSSPPFVPLAGEEIHFNVDEYNGGEEAADDEMSMHGLSIIFPFIKKAIEYRKPVLIGEHYIEIQECQGSFNCIDVSSRDFWNLKYAVFNLAMKETFMHSGLLDKIRAASTGCRVIHIKLNNQYHKLKIEMRERIPGWYGPLVLGNWIARVSFIEQVPPAPGGTAYVIPADSSSDSSYLKPLNNLLRTAVMKRGVVYIYGQTPEPEYGCSDEFLSLRKSNGISSYAGSINGLSVVPETVAIMRDDHEEIFIEEYKSCFPGKMALLIKGLTSIARKAGRRLKGNGEHWCVPVKWRDRAFLAKFELCSAEASCEPQEIPPEPGVLSGILDCAFRRNVKVIHVHPQEKQAVIMLRVDGKLERLQCISRESFCLLVSRVRGLCREPLPPEDTLQEGEMVIRREGRECSIGVSIIPTVLGESIVLELSPVRQEQVREAAE